MELLLGVLLISVNSQIKMYFMKTESSLSVFVTEKVQRTPGVRYSTLIHSVIHPTFTSFPTFSVDHNLFTLIDIFFLIDISSHKMEGSKLQFDIEIPHNLNLMDMSTSDVDQIKCLISNNPSAAPRLRF